MECHMQHCQKASPVLERKHRASFAIPLGRPSALSLKEIRLLWFNLLLTKLFCLLLITSQRLIVSGMLTNGLFTLGFFQGAKWRSSSRGAGSCSNMYPQHCIRQASEATLDESEQKSDQLPQHFDKIIDLLRNQPVCTQGARVLLNRISSADSWETSGSCKTPLQHSGRHKPGSG